MSHPKRLSSSAVFALLLAGCASQPVHYYTLMPADSTTAAIRPTPFQLEVLPVEIPAEVDRQELVVRQGATDVTILEGERWAVPLNEEIQEAFSANLSRRLETPNISGLTRPQDVPMLKVKLEIRQFESKPGQYALLDADWTLDLRNPTKRARLSCHTRFRTPVANTFDSLVSGHQKLLDKLASRIGVTANGLIANQNISCLESGELLQ